MCLGIIRVVQNVTLEKPVKFKMTQKTKENGFTSAIGATMNFLLGLTRGSSAYVSYVSYVLMGGNKYDFKGCGNDSS